MKIVALKVPIIYFFLFLLASCLNGTNEHDKPIILNNKEKIDSLKSQSLTLYKSNSSAVELDDYLIKAIELAEATQEEKAAYDLYIELGQRYRKTAKHGKAIEMLQKALSIAKDIKNDSLEAEATHYIAVNFRRINENAKALKFHTQALELAEMVRDTFLIHCSLNGIGNVYFDYKDFGNAVVYFHKSLNYIGTLKPNLLGKAINANLLGESWLYLGNRDSALYYLNISFDANQAIGSELGKGICHNGMGLVYYQFKEYNTAINEFNMALAIFDSLETRYYQSMALSALGSAYTDIGFYMAAEKVLKQTLNLAGEISGKRFALEASVKLAKLYNKVGDVSQSYHYSQMALQYKDSITQELQIQNAEAMNVLYKAEKQEREIFDLKYHAEMAELKLTRQRYIFAASAMLVFIFGLFLFFTFRQRRLRSKLNEIGLEQKLLRAQLNPHFIFNSLSAVQNFIMKNDKKAASEYLVNFSRLMRNILMGSGEEFILLENELEILDDYLKLQRLRFQNKFDYEFNVSEDCNPTNTMVPPMLVQPFVENAIEHGIRDIANQGLIKIKFNKTDNSLMIEIEDNGRGISDQQDVEKKKGHISMATKITKQRMQNIQSLTKQSCSFEVVDIKSKFGAGNGVLVRMSVPFITDN